MAWTFFMRQTPQVLPADYPADLRKSPAMLQLTDVSIRILGGLLEAIGATDTRAMPPDFDALWPPEGIREDVADEMLALWEDADAEDRAPEGLPGTPEEIALAEAAFRRIEAANAAPTPDGRIPGYKFESPDGWVVTPEECRMASMLCMRTADALAGDGSDDAREMRFLAWQFAWFCTVAMDHGGFRVW